MKIGFLVGDIFGISGGSNVIIEYAARLGQRGHEVTVITANRDRPPQPYWHPKLASLDVVSLAEAESRRFDVVLATWWLTFFDLWRLDSKVYGYFNQSLESRFHQERHYKLLNRLTYSLPLLFVTEARWLADFIRQAQPAGRVEYVPNGLSREHFPPAAAPIPATGPLRVLVEGPWAARFKGVPETFELLEETARQGVRFSTGWLSSVTSGQRPEVGGAPVEIHEQIPIDRVREVLGQYDVLLKLSRVEGMFGPPLEMFSQGGTAITYNVTGCDEYMVHGHNGLLVEPHNRAQISQYLRLLSERPELLARLKEGALQTAAQWPDWEQASDQMHAAFASVERSGWSNREQRSALAALSSAHGHWLSTQWESERLRAEREVGVGERVLLERYRRIKESKPAQVTARMVPDELRQKVRARMVRLLS